MIEMRKLKELVKLMIDNDLEELDLRDKDEQITLKRPSQTPVVVPGAAVPVAAAAPAAAPAAGGAEPAPAAPVDDGLIEIPSPMVGTFYTAASPDAAAFVKVGDPVGDDTVVCIIEAMKVFNEIKAERSGTIAEVLVQNGQAVEFGQPLFKVKP